MSTKRSYHFSCGNSTYGPVGFCASVRASNEVAALDALRAFLPEEVVVFRDRQVETNHDLVGVEYVRLYLNPDAVTVGDIDDDI